MALIYRAGLQPVQLSDQAHLTLWRGEEEQGTRITADISHAKRLRCIGRKRTGQSTAEETMPGKPG